MEKVKLGKEIPAIRELGRIFIITIFFFKWNALVPELVSIVGVKKIKTRQKIKLRELQ